MSDDLPRRYTESERLRQIEQKVAHLAIGGGASAAETVVLEDEAGVVRYESGLLLDGSYGVQVYDSNGLPLAGGGVGEAAELPFVPVGALQADNVQDALAELDAEKADSGHDHGTITPTVAPETLREYRRLFGKELRQWYGDLAMAQAQQVNVVVLGDSVAAGGGAGSAPAGYSGTSSRARWIEVFLRRMQQAHGTGRGTPYMPARARLLTPTDYFGVEWNHSGTGLAVNDIGGLGRNQLSIGASTSNYIETFQECDSFQIWYPSGLLGGMGDFNVIVDGSTIATVDIPQTGGNWSNVWDSRAQGFTFGPGRHTVRIQTAVTGTVIIEGGIFFNGDNGTGVHVYDASRGGQGAEWFSDDTTWAQSVGVVAPSLVIYALGLNDLTLGTPVATFKQAVIDALEAIRINTATDPSELIQIPYAHAWESAGAGFPVEHPETDWLPYREALYEVAVERGAAVLDLYHLFGYGKASADLADLVGPDEIHLNERGHRALGMLMADCLVGNGRSDRSPVDLTLPLMNGAPTITGNRPVAGSGRWRLTDYAGRATPEVVQAAGIPNMAGVPFNKNWVTNQPGITTLNVEGFGGLGASTGTITAAGPTPPFLPRYVEYASAATTGSSSGQGDNDLLWSITGGFFFFAQVMFTGLNSARTFVGLTSGTMASTVTANDPGNSHVGFSFSTGFTWQFSTRNGTTRTATTSTVPIALNEPVDFYIWCPSLSTTINCALRSTGTGQTWSKAITATLPGANTAMRRAWAVATTEAVSKALRVVRLYCETDH